MIAVTVNASEERIWVPSDDIFHDKCSKKQDHFYE